MTIDDLADEVLNKYRNGEYGEFGSPAASGAVMQILRGVTSAESVSEAQRIITQGEADISRDLLASQALAPLSSGAGILATLGGGSGVPTMMTFEDEVQEIEQMFVAGTLPDNITGDEVNELKTLVAEATDPREARAQIDSFWQNTRPAPAVAETLPELGAPLSGRQLAAGIAAMPRGSTPVAAVTDPADGEPSVAAAGALPALDGIGIVEGAARGEFGGELSIKDLLGISERATTLREQNRSEAPAASAYTQAGNAADEFNITANELFRQDPNESFVTNLLDVPAGVAATVQGLGARGAQALAAPFTTDEQIAQDQQLEGLAAAAAGAVPELPEPAEAAAGTTTGGLPDLGIAAFGAMDSINGVSDSFEGLSAAYEGQAAALTPPPELDSYDYDLGNFLSIINRGSLTPEWRDLQQYELQSNFDARRGELELGAASVRAQGQQARSSSMLAMAQEGRQVEAAIRSDRSAYVDGPIGDYFYGTNSGNSESAATGLMEFIRTQPGGENSWVQLAAIELGVNDVTDFNSLRSGLLSLQTELAPVARQFGMDINDITTNDDDLIEFVNKVVASDAGQDFAANAAEFVPGLGEALQMNDPNAYQNFLQPDIAQRLEAVQTFNEGGAQNRPAGDIFIARDGNEDFSNFTPSLLDAGNNLARLQGGPLVVTSGYRSPARQAEIYANDLRNNGGRPSGRVARNSEHSKGNAIDVDVSGMSVSEKRQFLQNAYAAGFRGFGFYGQNGHIHIDTGGNRTWGSRPDWAAGFNVNTGGY